MESLDAQVAVVELAYRKAGGIALAGHESGLVPKRSETTAIRGEASVIGPSGPLTTVTGALPGVGVTSPAHSGDRAMAKT